MYFFQFKMLYPTFDGGYFSHDWRFPLQSNFRTVLIDIRQQFISDNNFYVFPGAHVHCSIVKRGSKC